MALLSFVTGFLGNRSDRQAADGAPTEGGLLSAEPRIREHAGRISGLLPDLSREESEDLVIRPIGAFAERVHDLPASERHHHREPFGLLDHSLDVAEYAVRISLSEAFVSHAAPNPEDQEFRIPRLRYASFLFGLLHDIGKILGLYVKAGRETWNPLAETLYGFKLRHRLESAEVVWRAGRGSDAHVWVQSFLFGMFHTREMVEYVGAPLLAELLEGKTTAAERLRKVVAEADQRSAREHEAREARTPRSISDAGSEPALFEPAVNYADLVPKAFLEALREAVFALNEVDGDLWVGSEYVAFRYPSAFQKLAGYVRERLGPVSQKARLLQTGEAGARELAHHLAEHGALFEDPQAGAWKVQVAMSLGGAFDATAGVLVRKDFLLPGAAVRESLPLFSGGVSLHRTSDHAELAVPGFRAPPPSEPPAPQAPPASPAGARPPKDQAPEDANPDHGRAGDGVPRPAITAQTLLEDLREGILSGWLPSNTWNGQVYVTPDATYMITPSTFRVLVMRGLYTVDPGKSSGEYLNALAKLPCVRQHGNGRVVTKVLLRRNVKPCAAVIFDTRGLFRSEAELARAGYWEETQITEEAAPASPPQGTAEERGGRG